VSGRIGTKRYLINAGGVARSGCHVRTFSSDARNEARAGTERHLGPARRRWYNHERPTSVGQFLGKSKLEKRLADWIMATGVGLLGSELRDFEAERVERNDGWRREPFV
jgi:hypothetical protein